MDKKSFNDLDYIIEINEKRYEQYKSDYDKIIGKISNLLIIYSAISILLFPMCQEFCKPDCYHKFKICLIVFGCIFGLSLICGIIFFWPQETISLTSPSKYYTEMREEIIADPQRYPHLLDQSGQIIPDLLNKAMITSYIGEIEDALKELNRRIGVKEGIYELAFVLGMVSLIPYIICIVFHIKTVIADESKKDCQIQKVYIENIDKCRIFVLDTCIKEPKFDSSAFKNFQHGK